MSAVVGLVIEKARFDEIEDVFLKMLF